MANSNFEKYLCFSKDLTLATRLIAFVGISISVLLITVLVNGLSRKNFFIGRKIVLGFGLNWRHIHSGADTSETADPEGRILIILVIVYSILFFSTNVLLLLGAILGKPFFTLPWLTCEFVGCLSKLIGLTHHFITTEVDNYDNLFIVGSTVYILVTVWWWVVVYAAKEKWKSDTELEMSTDRNGIELFNSVVTDSPESYKENSLYITI